MKKIQYEFLALRHLAVCTKTFFSFFFNFFYIFESLWQKKPGILIPDLYFYDIKILPDINKNNIKTARKNYKNAEANIFYFFLFEWAEPGPNTCVNSTLNSAVWTVPWDKNGYFNTGFIFLRCKIPPDIKQNW